MYGTDVPIVKRRTMQDIKSKERPRTALFYTFDYIKDKLPSLLLANDGYELVFKSNRPDRNAIERNEVYLYLRYKDAIELECAVKNQRVITDAIKKEDLKEEIFDKLVSACKSNASEVDNKLKGAVFEMTLKRGHIRHFYSEEICSKLEEKILSFLEDTKAKDFKHFVRYMCVNRLWQKRIQAEIARRNKGVTIYTWLNTKSSSSHRSDATGGHSALETYSGGSSGYGVYVSFYPGDCDKVRRHPKCLKSVSHFHHKHHDTGGIEEHITLYGLKVNEINQAFNELHDTDMNSKKPWSYSYNCSDVVLSLLRKGCLFEYSNFNRSSWIMKLIFVLIGGAESINYLLLKPILSKLPGYNYLKDIYDKFCFRPCYDNANYLMWLTHSPHDYRKNDHTYFDIVFNLFQNLRWHLENIVPTSMFYLLAYFKNPFPFSVFLKWVYANTLHSIALHMAEDLLFALIRICLSYQFKNDYSRFLSISGVYDDLIGSPIVKLVTHWKIFELPYEENKFYCHLFLIFTAAIIGIPLGVHYWWNTTTTPKQIYEIIEPMKDNLSLKAIFQKKEKDEKNTDKDETRKYTFSEKAFRYDPKTLGIAGLLAATGFFMFKNKNLGISGYPLQETKGHQSLVM